MLALQRLESRCRAIGQRCPVVSAIVAQKPVLAVVPGCHIEKIITRLVSWRAKRYAIVVGAIERALQFRARYLKAEISVHVIRVEGQSRAAQGRRVLDNVHTLLKKEGAAQWPVPLIVGQGIRLTMES